MRQFGARWVITLGVIAILMSCFSLAITGRILWTSRSVYTQLATAIDETTEGMRGVQGFSEQDWNEAAFVLNYNSAIQNIHLAEERALNYLGLFESISFGLGSIGLLITIIATAGGLSYFNTIVRANKVMDDLRDVESQLKQLQDKVQLTSKNTSRSLYEVQLAQDQFRISQNPAAVSELYARALEIFPENPIPHYHIGYMLTLMGEYSTAEQRLYEALGYDETFPHAQLALGYVYRRMGDDPKHYNKIEEGVRRSREYYYKQAENWMLKGLSGNDYITGDDGESWHGALGGIYKRWAEFGDNQQDKLQKAKDHYRKALDVTPRSSYPVVNLAIINYGLGDFKEGLRYFIKTRDNALNKLLKEYDTHYDYADLLLSQVALVEIYKAETLSIIPMGDDKFTLQKFEESIESNIQAYLSLLPVGTTSEIANFVKDLRTVCEAEDEQSDEVKAIRKQTVQRIQEELKKRREAATK